MDSDDILKGRILTRREILGLLGAAGAAFLVACSGDDSPSQAADTPAATNTTLGGAPAASGGVTGVATPSTPNSMPSCVVLPELTEGPYFVDEKLDRSDIRSDPGTGRIVEGVEFQLTLNVTSVSGGSCTPMSGAMVDIWHCDAFGTYSDVQDPMAGNAYVGQKFLSAATRPRIQTAR